MTWEGNLRPGHYLDKGFNIKFVYRPKNNFYPNIAVGLDDFAGTGYFTKEYIVATKIATPVKFSLGMGWGKFSGENSFKNPLSYFSSSFLERPSISDNYKMGGSFSYDKWFRGESSLFGGIEYSLPFSKSTKLKVEYDPFNYFDFSANKRLDALYQTRKKDSNLNYGISFKINDFLSIDTSYIKGNTLNLNFNLSINFNNEYTEKNKFNPSIEVNKVNKNNSKQIFYENLLFNLNKNKLLLQTANLSKNDNLKITIQTSDHRNAIRSSSYSAYIANKVANTDNIKLSSISITNINAGTELNDIKYIASHLNEFNNVPYEIKIRNTVLDSGEPMSYLNDEFKPNVEFPVFFSSIKPSIVSHIGNPEKFYFGGLNLQHISELQFSRNLLLSSELNLRIYDNFKDTISGPGSVMEHVRTDIVQYLKEDDMYLTRMQLDYIWSPYKDIYTKISSGIFEQMYGGIGAEILYKPFLKNFHLGAELFYVKQRSFNQRFDFRQYETTTGHFNIGYRFAAGIESNLSFGRYLAKDDGYTLDLSKKTKSGFRTGIYFTRTNVSAETFGEGSFDKGFYFQAPLDLFSKDYNGNYSTFRLSPLVRDGGAKLVHDKDLKGLIYNSTYHELRPQWPGFLN